MTGGTGIYRNIGGDGTLVEFGNGKGRLTLHVLSLVTRRCRHLGGWYPSGSI